MGVRNQLVSVSELNGSEDFSKQIIQTVSVASPLLPELSNGCFVSLLLASAGSHSGLQEKSFKKKIALDNLKVKSPVEHLEGDLPQCTQFTEWVLPLLAYLLPSHAKHVPAWGQGHSRCQPVPRPFQGYASSAGFGGLFLQLCCTLCTPGLPTLSFTLRLQLPHNGLPTVSSFLPQTQDIIGSRGLRQSSQRCLKPGQSMQQSVAFAAPQRTCIWKIPAELGSLSGSLFLIHFDFCCWQQPPEASEACFFREGTKRHPSVNFPTSHEQCGRRVLLSGCSPRKRSRLDPPLKGVTATLTHQRSVLWAKVSRCSSDIRVILFRKPSTEHLSIQMRSVRYDVGQAACEPRESNPL